MQFELLPPKNIPYFDHDKSLAKTIVRSGKRRGMNPMFFVYRKTRNILLSRFSYFCPLNSWRIKMHRWRGVHIGENVYIGMYCVIDNAYPEYIYIEDNASLAGEVTVIAHTNPYKHFSAVIESKVQPTIICKGAWIGIKSVILSGVVVGVNSIVTAGSVVDRSVNDYTMVRGNPAKKVLEYEILLQTKE